jgi:hypothetical protein
MLFRVRGVAAMALRRNTIQWDDALARVEPIAFVELVGDYYLREGYRVEHAGAESREQGLDGNIDLRLHRGTEHVVVQCKHWRACQMPPDDVHDLLGIAVKEGATGAILVTTGEFTAAALRAGRNERIQLIDGRMIRALLDPIAVLQAAHASDARATANPPLRLRSKREVRRRAARPYLVPAMVFAGCLIVAIGILLSLPSAAHPTLRKNTGEAAQGLPAPQQQATKPVIARTARIPGVFQPIDHEAARVALRPIAGVRNTAWVDASNLVVTVEGAGQYNPAMIETICRALEPLGDTVPLVVNLREFGARSMDVAMTLSRNCQLPREQLMQAGRQADVVASGPRQPVARQSSGPH